MERNTGWISNRNDKKDKEKSAIMMSNLYQSSIKPSQPRMDHFRKGGDADAAGGATRNTERSRGVRS